MVKEILDYEESYIDACFYAWFKASRPRARAVGGSHIIKILPPTLDGRKPNIVTVSRWMEKYDWDARADALDAELSRKLDAQAIEERAALYKEIASKMERTMNAGYKYIEENGFDTAAAAVRAVFGGAEKFAQFSSAADSLLSIGNMTNQQVEKRILRLLGKNDDENPTIDVEPEDISSVVDATDDSDTEEDDDKQDNNPRGE